MFYDDRIKKIVSNEIRKKFNFIKLLNWLSKSETEKKIVISSTRFPLSL